ncbi:MAG TPA: hypothetical protein VNH46_03845, partial [Gemmatimonadales bacterium]|nr:hypothetical protein [Gemmatimonadales bacterium]
MTTPLPFQLFSDAWARACAEALNLRDAYRTAAASWEGAVLLVMQEEGDETGRRVFLDLHH